MKQALGLIETIGLAAAIEAADAAVKAANVTLLGYENTKGSGKITIKIVGNVGAVKAGVAAGVAAASRVGQVYGQRVIARPHDEIEQLISNLDRGRRFNQPETAVKEPAVQKPAVPEVEDEKLAVEETADGEPQANEEPEEKQCAGITKSGTRCKLIARPGSDYCHLHGG